MATTESTPRENAPANTWVALLGRKDEPADGVEDYCVFLGRALEKRGVRLERVRVPWCERGWPSALRELRREAKGWRGRWVLLQYTALGWSRRGFPIGILAALAILKRRRVNCAVVFHEPYGFEGPRWIDRLRGRCQEWVIRKLHGLASKSIFTIPVEGIRWLPRADAKTAFIPIGANIPEILKPAEVASASNGTRRTIAVFCLSVGTNRHLEVADFAHTARRVHEVAATRLIVLGRGSEEMRAEIERALVDSEVDFAVLGMLPPEQVSETLSSADALLFVSGLVSQRRGSALAALACGLPIVGYSGATAGTPMEEAGVELVPYRDRNALAEAMVRVLTDEALHAELRDMSRRAQEKYFSWTAIAKNFTEALDIDPS